MNDVTLPPGLRPDAPPQGAAPLTAPTGFDPARQVHPQSAHTGALITGVDLRQPLSPAEVAGISAALRQWKVVYFHDQPLSHEQHIALARQFGAPTIGHPVFGHVAGYPEVYSIAKHRHANRFVGSSEQRPWSGWHTDVTAAINPPAASLLRGVVIPPYGGDTQWTNLVAAYQALSTPLRGFVDTLWGRHQFSAPPGAQATEEYQRLVGEARLVSEHPLVRVHPDTGERALFVSPSFLKQVVGLNPRESRVLLELLWEHVVRPEFSVRFKWQPGSLAFWDNRATAHVAPTDIFDLDFDRQLYRITLEGEVPVGVDGQRSRAIEGHPLLAHHAGNQ